MTATLTDGRRVAWAARRSNGTPAARGWSRTAGALAGALLVLMSPRPGRILVDRELPFSRSGRDAAELRADPDFVGACHELRVAITEPRQEGTPQ